LERLIIEQIYIEKENTDVYVYIPIEFPMEKDELRPAESEYQCYIDGVIRELLKDFEMPTVEVRGTLEQRVEQLMQKLVEIKKN
jgi:hypothetical protein